MNWWNTLSLTSPIALTKMSSGIKSRLSDTPRRIAPGRLHVLFFHLVSPTAVFVESSTLAPPLRADWVREATTSVISRAKRLPDHVQHVIEEMIGPMGMADEDVAKHRERLRRVQLFQ
ncbi:hypothetical protein PINS_up010114 [Pythium insidiosum]|nr:hypothetical protein PINS_up010114 [Pythium insidiosum]